LLLSLIVTHSRGRLNYQDRLGFCCFPRPQVAKRAAFFVMPLPNLSQECSWQHLRLGLHDIFHTRDKSSHGL